MKQAFSLVELSIVLVILGLLVGGVLAGKSLIRASQVRAQIAQHTSIDAAVLTFRDKYMALPGDMPNATAFWTAASQPDKVTNGNGDGRIIGAATAGTSLVWGHTSSAASESQSVFEHLAMAGLYNMPSYDETLAANNIAGIALPEAKFQGTGTLPTGAALSVGGIRVGYEDGYLSIPSGHKIRWGSCPFSGLDYGYSFFYCGLNPEEAWIFDTKMDDGKPLSGRFFVTANRYIYRVPGDANNELNNSCLPAGSPNAYNLTRTDLRQCYPDITASF